MNQIMAIDSGIIDDDKIEQEGKKEFVCISK